jgi:hypothetical protein
MGDEGSVMVAAGAIEAYWRAPGFNVVLYGAPFKTERCTSCDLVRSLAIGYKGREHRHKVASIQIDVGRSL